MQCNVSATVNCRCDTKTEDAMPRAESVNLDTVVNIIDSVTDEMAHHKEKVNLHLGQYQHFKYLSNSFFFNSTKENE